MEKIIEPACYCLQQISTYPYQEEKDIPFLQELLTEFPSIDLIDEIKQWKAWLLDNTDYVGGRPLNMIKGKKINYRARLRRWCRNAAMWKNRKEGSDIQQRNLKKAKCEFEKAPPRGERNIKEVW